MRFILIIIVPIFVSLLLVFPFGERIPLQANNGTVTINTEEIFKPSARNTIRAIFSTPFDLEWYHICFGMKTSDNPKRSNWSVEFDYSESFAVPTNSTACSKAVRKLNGTFTYNWVVSTSLSINFQDNGQIQTLVPFRGNTTSYATPEHWGLLAKNVLFVFSVWAVILLIVAIYNLVIGKK